MADAIRVELFPDPLPEDEEREAGLVMAGWAIRRNPDTAFRDLRVVLAALGLWEPPEDWSE